MRHLLIFNFVLSLSGSIYSQSGQGVSNGSQLPTVTQQAIASELFKNAIVDQNTLPYDAIEGSPYLMEDFMEGDILFEDGKVLKSSKLNWNLYTGKFEFYNEQLDQAFILDCKAIPIQKISWNESEYICIDGEIFELIFEESNLKILLKGNIKFNPEVKLEPYKQPQPPSFSTASYDIFVLRNQKSYEIKRNLKNLTDLLPISKTQLKSIKSKANYHPDDRNSVYALFRSIKEVIYD